MKSFNNKIAKYTSVFSGRGDFWNLWRLQYFSFISNNIPILVVRLMYLFLFFYFLLSILYIKLKGINILLWVDHSAIYYKIIDTSLKKPNN
jgi:hypothetical protein